MEATRAPLPGYAATDQLTASDEANDLAHFSFSFKGTDGTPLITLSGDERKIKNI